MHFMQLVIANSDNDLLLSVSQLHNIYSVNRLQALFALFLLCSSQRKEQALLFCRPFVQSHEGICS